MAVVLSGDALRTGSPWVYDGAMKTLGLLLIAGIVVVPAVAGAAEEPGKPRVYALVSAVGSEISYVRQRQQVGSRLDNFQRFTLPIPDASVDAAVLRGLERSVLQDDPDAQRVYLRLSPDEVKGVYPYKRGEVIVGRLVAALDRMPQRKEWDRIIMVTPRYVNSGRESLGTKLHGIGIYVQPLERGYGPSPETQAELNLSSDPETISPDGAKSRSSRFVAPYFYAQIWVLDAKTMQVLETDERYDFQRIYDPTSDALDVEKSIPVEKLAAMVENFVERASARALNERIGEVIVKDRKVVSPPR